MTFVQKELKNAYIGERNPFDDYQEVEYIQSSGTQYINTNYNPKTTTEFEIDYYINSYVGQYASPFWTRYAHNNQAYYIWFENTDVSYYCFWNNKVSTSTVTFSWVGTRKHITYHNNILSNGNESVIVATNQQPYWNMVIFAENNQWTVKEFADIKLYSFKLREWSTLIRDYIPCYRKSDNVIWLYDFVNNQFYTNAWTWTFTKWPDVN